MNNNSNILTEMIEDIYYNCAHCVLRFSSPLEFVEHPLNATTTESANKLTCPSAFNEDMEPVPQTPPDSVVQCKKCVGIVIHYVLYLYKTQYSGDAQHSTSDKSTFSLLKVLCF